jgi:CheY-like chemotaxis protein
MLLICRDRHSPVANQKWSTPTEWLRSIDGTYLSASLNVWKYVEPLAIDYMTESIVQTRQISFQAQELPRKLMECAAEGGDGCWQLQFERSIGQHQDLSRYVGVSQGTILSSGSSPYWTTPSLLKILQRYVLSARKESVKPYFNLLKNQSAQSLSPVQITCQMIEMGFLEKGDLLQALRLKILSDLDTYSQLGAGTAHFIPRDEGIQALPIPGFNAVELLQEAMQRQGLWSQIKPYVPSINLIPNLDEAALARANLSAQQKAHLRNWVQSGKTIHHIAISLAKDSLEVARIFARFVGAGIIQLRAEQSSEMPTVMIIDDSALVLKQFQHWVTALGFRVVSCQNAQSALSSILLHRPDTIFIDINMPAISGFELAKQIRQKPEISEIPMVILTGEQKLSNKWRAQWSGCDFLTKPLSMSEVGLFQTQLQELLQRLNGDSLTPAAVA